MKTLVKIISGRLTDKPCCFVTPISKYERIEGDAKRFFTGQNPVIYEELDGCRYSAELADIGYADLEKNVGKLGNTYYKVPKEYINPVA